MAVLIEATSVVLRADALLKKVTGGWEAFIRLVPNKTLCADNEIVRVGFMYPDDVELFIKFLQSVGLEYLREGKAIDIAVVDQLRGLMSPCDWLEFGRVDMKGTDKRVAACRMVGSKVNQLVTPDNWKFEQSLSSTYGFVPDGQGQSGMKFLRHEDGIDVYLNALTGKEVYVGRTGQS